MKQRQIGVLVAIVIALSGCKIAQNSQAYLKQIVNQDESASLPDWVKAPSCSSEKLCAVGSGVNPSIAKKAAYPALASQISVEVNDKHILEYSVQNAFARETEKRWTELSISDVSLDGAQFTKEVRANNTSYVQIEIAKARLKTTLNQQINSKVKILDKVVSNSSGEGFDEWWRLQNELSTVKTITRNQNILEQEYGQKSDLSVDRLIGIYYKMLNSSFNSRELVITDNTDHMNSGQLKDALSAQLNHHEISEISASFFGRQSSIELSTLYDAEKIGDEFYASGELTIQLKNRKGQPLALKKICEKIVTYDGRISALRQAGKKLQNKFSQEKDLLNDLINHPYKKGNSKCV